MVKHQPWKGVYPEELITEETNMQAETLSCDNCGGMLELPNTTNYATCARCGAHLVVRRGETARYTEVLDAEAPARSDRPVGDIGSRTNSEEEFSSMKVDLALLTLDHEWEDTRSAYMVRTINGRLFEPGKIGVVGYIILGSLIPIGSLIAFMALKPAMSQAELLQLIVVAIVIPLAVCAWMARRSYMRYQNYTIARNEYLARRAALINQR
jgi:hypothetical protein